MKGVILAGGNGTRLLPLTRLVNKHCLPVGHIPMIQHCVEKLVGAEITDILVVTGGEHIGGIAEYLGSGMEFGCRFTYRIQDEAGGIAQALGVAEGYIGDGETMCVLLGDNIFSLSARTIVNAYKTQRGSGDVDAMVVLCEVPDPKRFGVAQLDDKGNIVAIQEKPSVPPSSLAVTGIYFYDSSVFDVVAGLKPSARKELEITDVNNHYIARKRMGFFRMPKDSWWTDAGTHESRDRADALVRGALP